MMFLNASIDWLAHGLLAASWWQIILYTLVTTHITIASVTIYLHRHQAHRAMDLHALPIHISTSEEPQFIHAQAGTIGEGEQEAMFERAWRFE